MNRVSLIVKPHVQKRSQQKINIFSLVEIPESSQAHLNISKLVFPQTSRVKIIGKSAFSGCYMLTDVTINETVEEIGDYSFFECKKLSIFSITGDSRLKVIGDSAFERTSLKSFDYPASLKKIGKKSFYIEKFQGFDFSKTQLEVIDDKAIFPHACEVILPNTIRKILINNKNFQIKVMPGGKYVTVEDSLLYSITERIIIFSNKELKHVTIRNGIERIGINAFAVSNIKHVSFPTSIKEINASAFEGCSNLISIIFQTPSALETIGKRAFAGCVNVRKINLPSSLVSIGSSAFACCSTIKKISIPFSVIELGNRAFESCISLAEVKILSDSNLEIIGKNCFGNTKVTKFIIPSEVKEIKGNIFGQNTVHSLKVYPLLFRLEDELLFNNFNEVVAIFNRKEKIVIPDGAKIIKKNANCGNNITKEIIIPSSVEKLEAKCFENDSNVSIITKNGSILKAFPDNE